MDGLDFLVASPPVRSDPARADIACFVGFVAPRHDGPALRTRLVRALRDLGWRPPEGVPPLPPGMRVLPDNVMPGGDRPLSFARWLEARGWTRSRNAVAPADLFRRAAAALLAEPVVQWWTEFDWVSPSSTRSAADLLELSNLPVPLDTWDVFSGLFAWDQRPLLAGSTRHANTAIGAAVRRFFLQGGRKCYVVRLGDPWPLFTPRSERVAARSRVLETIPPPTPVDRSSWRGVAHLFGLPDVSFLCVPDLPELCAVDDRTIAPETAPEGEERFVECATRVAPETSRTLRAFPVSRCDETGFAEWASVVAGIGRLLQRDAREVQLIAAVPLPADEFASRAAQWDAVSLIQTAFVQLAYPWLYTRESQRLPGAIEAPDAMLAGLLANNALTLGTWNSAARERVATLTGLEPTLGKAELESPLEYHGDGSLRQPRTRRERVSIFAPAAVGFQLLSDVTTDDDEAYRPANVNRLVASIRRAARLAGESAVFMNNGETVWRRVRSALEELLHNLWGAGAIAGATAADAYDVRCDRSTMTQADLDAGRVIARVQFTAASPIERITVVFAIDERA